MDGGADTRPRVRPGDAGLIPFSLLWCGFAIFWESLAMKTGELLPELWGVPFVLVGLYFVFGRFVVDAYVRAHTSWSNSDDLPSSAQRR